MSLHRINLKINGVAEQVDVASNTTLLQMLRDRLALTGTKNGCAAGECGACTVMLNGEPINSCMILAVECEGADLVTIEGLAKDGQLDVVQQAIIDQGGVQCGFCTPGILISARALLNRNPDPTDYEIRDALVGNLCRCTGYVPIIAAVKQAAQMQKQAAQ
ncbi:MAG TPA: (2Fe-2S)-binding protein [Anaerolineaceae bacterium]|nr:(2Fe-2S)-binding protein [Anaerolineaceae bacterium]HPN53733.1 (2Fe-2S)-binding protein [Anaerolineaceae bacterium]